MEHLSKRNLGHVYTVFVGQTRKRVYASELLVAGWLVFTQLRVGRLIHAAQSLIVISTGQHLPVALGYNYRYFWFFFPNTDAKIGAFLQPSASCVLWEVTGGILGFRDFRLVLQYCTR